MPGCNIKCTGSKSPGGSPPKRNKSSCEVFSGFQSNASQNQVITFSMCGDLSSAHLVKVFQVNIIPAYAQPFVATLTNTDAVVEDLCINFKLVVCESADVNEPHMVGGYPNQQYIRIWNDPEEMKLSVVGDWARAIAAKNNGPLGHLYKYKPNFTYGGDKTGANLLPLDHHLIDDDVAMVAHKLYAGIIADGSIADDLETMKGMSEDTEKIAALIAE
eukprot:2047987-Ditylum_brightwellii.AAC.1